jgi:glutamyl-tRNA reductase
VTTQRVKEVPYGNQTETVAPHHYEDRLRELVAMSTVVAEEATSSRVPEPYASLRTQLVAIGVDHATAGIEVREQLAFSETEIPGVLRRLIDPNDPLLEQAAILSTCNRVEIYGVAAIRPAERRLASFLALDRGLRLSDVARHVYVYRDAHVVHRLAATAAGIHSLVLGEAQIQGQVSRALELALGAGSAGPELRRLFESAISAGRSVRSDTAIGRGKASVPYLGVEFARRSLGTLSQSTVLLIGTGEAGQLAAEAVVRRGARRLLVAGSAPDRTLRLAESHGAHAIRPDQLDDALAQSDVVISATGAPRPTLGRERVRHALSRRGPDAPPLLLIDLSVPRDVDPAVTLLAGVEVYTVDDLRDTIERTLIQRRAALPAAHAILEGNVARFTEWLSRRERHQAEPRRGLSGARRRSQATAVAGEVHVGRHAHTPVDRSRSLDAESGN